MGIGSFDNFKNFQKNIGVNILAIDYGKKITGLATFCPGREPFPQPFDKIVYKDDYTLIKDLAVYISDESIELIILGLPLFLDGKESKMTKEVRSFSNRILKQFPSIPLVLQDETLTSQEAKDRMLNSPLFNFKVDLKKIDALAASIILEDYLKNE